MANFVSFAAFIAELDQGEKSRTQSLNQSLSQLIWCAGNRSFHFGTTIQKQPDVIRRASVDDYASACCQLDLWPFDLISISQTQVHTWPNFGGSSSNSSYQDIVFTRFFESLPNVTLAYDILTPNANQHTHEPKYICDQNWVNFLSLVFTVRAMLAQY